MDMPDGALGFRAAGKLEVSDVKETIMPPISEVLAADGRSGRCSSSTTTSRSGSTRA